MPAYVYLWEFQVAPDKVAAFEQAYGPSGDWVRLFRRAPGYARSELHRDLLNPQRFVSVDYWESRAAWEDFRSRFAAEFAALDARCEALTLRETELGRFEPVA
jgi:quinol monooxygenase YgiN